jgi:hypothetical protein
VKKDVLDNEQVTNKSGKSMYVMSIAGDPPSRSVGSWIFRKVWNINFLSTLLTQKHMEVYNSE